MNPHHHRSTLFPVCKSCVLITRLVFFILGTALILSAIPAQAQSEAGRQTYAIPAGTLKSVLVSFGQANGVMISYTESEIAGKRSSGIHGSFTVLEALNVLLTGTGLEASKRVEGGFRLRPQTPVITGQTLPLMTVSASADTLKQGTVEEGYRVSDISSIGPWGKRSLRDTPYSMSVVPSDLIENVNAQNMGQIFKMNPLTQEPAIQNITGLPLVRIRGFETINPVFDGIPLAFRTGSAVSVVEIDRVEILSGTSGFLYGGGRVGGAVNYVTKNSTDTPLRRLTFGNYGGTQFYGHADIGGKFDDQGRFGYRANLLYQGGDTAIGEPVNQKVANIVLDGHLTDTLYADIKYTYNDYRKEATQPIFNNIVERIFIDTSKRYSPKWASNDLESHKAYTSLRWDPSKYLTIRSAFSYQYANLRADQISLNEQVDRTFIPRTVNYPREKHENYGGYIYLDTRFSTFSVDHKLTLGYSSTFYDYFRTVAGEESQTGTTSFSLSALKHIPEPSWRSSGDTSMISVYVARYDNVLIGDNIIFNDQWSAMVGFNYATAINKSSYPGNNVIKYDKSKLTPTVSLLYKPIEEVTTYASYMEALEAGLIVGNTYANRGTVLPSLVSKQYEVGLKYDINPNLLLSAALFRIEKANQYSDNATPIPTYVQDGLQVHNGVELVLTGKVTDNLTIIGGGTLMDINVEKSNNPALEGKKPVNAASRMGKIYAEYALPWIPGFSLTGGIYYTGEQYGNTTNTDKIPSYTLYDVGARYATRVLNKSLVVRLNVINLTGKNYWQNANYLGVPRTVAFSVSMMF
ncbi:TonB-dependent siderophore receptor [Nitrosomonas europaea]|uniref:TonB-dependent receptor protein n=1 Tax=Nitrosomonas europaea (strain ATCC 19718 / CIP 103999 / KCTC 2705 / NBRC 14298) TaxID=228410 RepID=Q82VT6_NITEU|nr:TonB-dependent receptor [Nitrosomonas europaea]CAD84889.1 TonB-dependent receptor protein [Nitrosomonas europaea ATCC 19718]SDW27937.1 iron complex outermembrane recepter protein [Nitrosomonas europaea]SES87243.1 iron complex outermembrane recepter protein [Nitrosomonas europaea]SJZ38391.1 iron complex outermembrane recepter protein [Nitrosomonas europaea]